MNGTDDTDRKADESQRQAPLPTPAPPPANDAEVLGGTEGNPTGTRETETEKLLRGTRTIEILQFSANAALAVIGVIALYIYGGQLKVMRQQLVGTQGAVVNLRFDFAPAGLRVIIDNAGHVIAPDVHASL